MKAYKGFNKDMTCRDYQYEEGKAYETDRAELCRAGFHACEAPLEVFQYYKPGASRYHVVDLDGVSDERDGGSSKVVAKKITIGAEIGIPGLVKAHIEWTRNNAEKEGAATSGYRSSAATSGEESSAATSGDWSSAATSGYRSSAATSGNGSSAATSGEESSAAVQHPNGIALACGKNSRAMGVVGSYIILTEWSEDEKELLGARMARVDGEAVKAGTWYTLRGGELVEVPDEDQD